MLKSTARGKKTLWRAALRKFNLSFCLKNNVCQSTRCSPCSRSVWKFFSNEFETYENFHHVMLNDSIMYFLGVVSIHESDVLFLLRRRVCWKQGRSLVKITAACTCTLDPRCQSVAWHKAGSTALSTTLCRGELSLFTHNYHHASSSS